MSVLDKKSAYSHLNDPDGEDGQYLYHTACMKCDSSDGLAVYQKTDEDGNEFKDGYCWVCQSYHSPQMLGEKPMQTVEKVDLSDFEEDSGSLTVEEVNDFRTSGSRKRGIRKDMMEMYGVKMQFREDGAVTHHYYPVTKSGKITGYKPRELPKNFKLKQVGDTKAKGAELFGQHIFESGQVQVAKKWLIITEGELDAIALQQVIWDKGNPQYRNAVVSITSGSSSAVKCIQENWNWINTFNEVVLFFDQDEPGKKASLDIAKKLPLGKCKIAKFSEKDPCDMLRKGKQDELYNALWKAETYAPDGVLAGTGLWNLVSTPLAESNAHYPWKGLDKMLHGIRPELVTLTAGSGVAKSTFARMIAYHLQQTTNDNIGMIFLEESVKKTSLQIMSLDVGKQLHLPETECTEDEMREAFDNTMGTGQYYYFDDFASQDFDAVCEAIMYMARAANCKYIFLDHISMLVSGGEYGDERKALDAICTKLRSLVQQLDVTLFAITHLKRPQGEGHEVGAQTSLSQLRGSAGIAQLSDIVIGFERNSQADDPIERNTTHVRILKNRFSGESGLACSLLYDFDTGRARELSEEEVDSMDTDLSQFDEMQETDTSNPLPDDY